MSDLRECVTGETLVMLADGRRVPIRELVDQEPEVLAVSEMGKIVKAKTDCIWSVGRKPVFKVSLASGRTIRATGKHRLLSGNGYRWHPAGVGKWLKDLGIFGQRSHEKRLPRSVFELANDQVALLLRHLWATDGCITLGKSHGKNTRRAFFSTCSRGLALD